MSYLVVVGYDDMVHAEKAREKLLEWQHESFADIEDIVVAIKHSDGKVKLDQTMNLTGQGAASGTVWGALIGALFLSPVLGAAIGAGSGAIAGALSDIGINDNFMKEIAQSLQPGTSALFVLVNSESPDHVAEHLKGSGGKIIQTSLNHDQQEKLQAALDEAKKAGADGLSERQTPYRKTESSACGIGLLCNRPVFQAREFWLE